ncbi:unnamed protein product [Peniophora sp. CBMAI 1063]|nr:unnamed protein product [Peniophora sp. CBMAI 1063]
MSNNDISPSCAPRHNRTTKKAKGCRRATGQQESTLSLRQTHPLPDKPKDAYIPTLQEVYIRLTLRLGSGPDAVGIQDETPQLQDHDDDAPFTLCDTDTAIPQVEDHNEAAPFTLCKTNAQIERAVAELSQHEYVCLDCEGRDFGRTDGELSLLCLGTPLSSGSQLVFIFDVPALIENEYAIGALRWILSTQSITKVTFDGRSDYLEIWDTFGVQTSPILDLQLAEALSLPCGAAQQRLPHCYREIYVNWRKDRFSGIRRVIGMDQAMRLYVPYVTLRKDEAVKKMHQQNESFRWMERPLPPHMLQYAANDIYAISYLLDAFQLRRIIPDKSGLKLSKLLMRSLRYADKFFVRSNMYCIVFLMMIPNPLFPCSACTTM